jgi:hypothetical protein
LLREISSGANWLKACGTRLIMDRQGEQKFVGEFGDFLCAETKDGSVIGVIGFQLVEEISGGDPAVDAETGAIRDSAVADEKDPAVIIFNLGVRGLGMLGFFLRLSGGGQA